jgi:hypothetical protein
MNFLAFIIIMPVAWAWMEMVPGDKFEDCSAPGKAANMMNYSALEIIMESDTEFFLNGDVTFLKSIHSPWKFHVIGERWHRNQWVSGVENKMEDACPEIHNKIVPTYELFKDQKGCPLEAGVRVKFSFLFLYCFQVFVHNIFLIRINGDGTCLNFPLTRSRIFHRTLLASGVLR